MPFIYNNRTGVGFNTGYTGAQVSNGGGGSSPYVLLNDLVAGWALTAGPQQTLDSSGVIASGPHDGTTYDEVGAPNGPITFGASGANIPGPADALYQTGIRIPDDTGLKTGASSWAFSALVTVDDLTAGYGSFLGKFDNIAGEWAVAWSDEGQGLIFEFYIYGPDQDFPASVTVGSLSTGQAYALTGGYDAGADQLWMRLNNGTEGVTSWAGGNASTSAALGVGCQPGDSPGTVFMTLDGKVKYFRFWKGDTASVRTDAAWINNAGNGRTDAEVAAYTG